ncbi:MAG TPA: hypothetical protein VF043_03920 [Ktedonobacteraceae bacterium]
MSTNQFTGPRSAEMRILTLNVWGAQRRMDRPPVGARRGDSHTPT